MQWKVVANATYSHDMLNCICTEMFVCVINFLRNPINKVENVYEYLICC